MTSDQKDKSVILDILFASRPVPRTVQYLRDELTLAGRRDRDVHTLLRDLERSEYASKTEDGLGVERWLITPKGLEALA